MTRIKKINKEAIYPSLTPSGFDIHAPERVDMEPGQTYAVGSGLSISIPKGYVGILYPRSKMALKKNVKVGAQILHHDYNEEITIHLHNAGKDLLEISKNDKVAQLIVVPCLTEHSFE